MVCTPRTLAKPPSKILRRFRGVGGRGNPGKIQACIRREGMALERPGFFKHVFQSAVRRRTPLQWVTFVLLLAVVWLFMVGFIIAGSFWIPQTRTGWVLLIALGPPTWMLVELSAERFRKSRFYQVTIGGMPIYARISLGVILVLGLMLSGYAAFSACAWVLSEL